MEYEQTSMKGDKSLANIYTSPNFEAISRVIANRRRPSPSDSLVLDRAAPANAVPGTLSEQPFDDLLLITCNEIGERLKTQYLGFIFGCLVRDAYRRYLQGKEPNAHYNRKMKTEEDLLKDHKPSLDAAKRCYAGTSIDLKKLNMQRSWNAENRLRLRANVSEIRVMYELMAYFNCDYRSALVQVIYDGAIKYLESGREGSPYGEGVKPPIPSDLKGALVT